MVVRLDPRMALRVVRDVEQDLPRVGRKRDLLEDGARAAALLVDDDRAAGRAVCVADCVGAPFGDRGEERLGGQRPVDRTGLAEAASGYAAPLLLIVLRGPGVLGDDLRHSDE